MTSWLPCHRVQGRQEAMDREAAEGSAERAGKGVKRSLDASEKGVGLAYAVGLGEKDIGEAAENEHLLRRVSDPCGFGANEAWVPSSLCHA